MLMQYCVRGQYEKEFFDLNKNDFEQLNLFKWKRKHVQPKVRAIEKCLWKNK